VAGTDVTKSTMLGQPFPLCARSAHGTIGAQLHPSPRDWKRGTGGDGSRGLLGSEPDQAPLVPDRRHPGYTRFTAEHGDAAAARLAGTFAGLARDAVEARSGRVIELRGDEVLAVFDHAGQSVRAALELQATCAEEIGRDPALPLLAGIGLAAGEAVPVEDGFRGAALNLAARLCSKAGAGDVLVAQWVAELAGEIEGVSMVDRGTVELKGFPEPVAYLQASVETVPPSVSERAAPAGQRAVLPLDLDASRSPRTASPARGPSPGPCGSSRRRASWCGSPGGRGRAFDRSATRR
jgi:hypothetical protein